MTHPVVATMIGDLEGCAPSQPFPAVNQHHFTAPTERTPSRESATNGPSVSVQAWRAAVPRSRGSPVSTPFHGADGAGALQGLGQQMAHRFRCRPGGLRSLAAAVRR